MILCGDDCVPCCDFCIYSVHGTLETDGTTGPIGCSLHLNAEHQEIADSCGHCEDFHCFRVKEDLTDSRINYTKKEDRYFYGSEGCMRFL